MSGVLWGGNDEAWWEADAIGKEPHEIAISRIKQLMTDQIQRYDDFKRLIAAFEFGPNSNYDHKNLTDRTVSFNHAGSAIETVAAKLLKSRTMPTPLTYGGTALDQENAKELEKAVLGECKKNDVETITEDMVMDGLVCGIAWLWVPHGCGDIQIKFVPADDVVIDEAEARYRETRSIYIRRWMDRDVVYAKWGKPGDHLYGSARDRKKAIKDAGKLAGSASRSERSDKLRNQIEVWYCYHLRSSEDADDGAFAVCIEGGTLEFTSWERDRFPASPYVPYRRLRQLHGRSMMADFLPAQLEHDKVTARIQKSYHRMGGTFFAIPRESGIEERELSNGQGTIFEYDAAIVGPNPITVLTPNFANAETFNYRQQIVSEMQMSKGIPSMAMTGQVPEGLQGASGKAIQLAEEQVAERLTVQHRSLDRVMIDLAWLIVDEAEAIVESDESYSVPFRDKRNLKKVKWKDALIARGEYIFDIAPAGDLAKTPSARFEQLQLEVANKIITTDQYKKLWNHGADLEAEYDMDLADVEIVDLVLAKIARENKQILPEGVDDLQLAIRRGRKFLNLCRVKGESPEVQKKISDYIKRAVDLDKKAKLAAAQEAAAMGQPQQQPQQAAA